MIFRESATESWTARYGQPAPTGLPEIAGFLSHRSVRRFTDQPIPRETVSGLIAAAQSAATSSNLQSWSLVSIQDPQARAKIAELCGNQKQILTAGWFFVFVADLNRIAQYTQAKDHALDTVEMYTVAVIDAALAAERMVCAAESLDLGICYIGALRNQPDEVNKLLALPNHTFGVFGLCLGHPDPERPGDIKPRLAQDQVWFEEQYPTELEASEYDARYAAFAESQGMPNDAPWSTKCGTRIQISGLSGREKLGDFLRLNGLISR